MGRTVVVLPRRWTGVLPAAAVPALRAAAHVYADSTVPAEVRDALGASVRAGGWIAYRPLAPEVLVTTAFDPADPLMAAAEAVIVPLEPAGAGLLDAVAVMDRLRSPGGCPWDAEQTHTSLLKYLVEECYELHEAIEDGPVDAVREELGDVLLQVLFHARIAAGDGAFDIDDVAAELVAKLVGRHPHVFPPDDAATPEVIVSAERQEHRWEELKRAEKRRGSSVDGVAAGQPAVAFAAKVTSRTARAGLPADLLPDGSGTGEQLFALTARATLAGADPEAELRAAVRRFTVDVRAAEQAARAAGLDPHTLDAADWHRFWPAGAG